MISFVDGHQARLVMQLGVFFTLYICLGSELIVRIWPKIEGVVEEHSTFSARGWAFLEFEEGREFGTVGLRIPLLLYHFRPCLFFFVIFLLYGLACTHAPPAWQIVIPTL